MKIIRNGICFVELEDLKFLKDLPLFVRKERKEELFYSAYIPLEKFTGEDSVRYFEEQEAILDYDQLSALTDQEIQNQINLLKNYLFALAQTKALRTLPFGFDMNLNAHMKKDQNMNLSIQKTAHMLKQLALFKENRALYDREIQNLYFDLEDTRKR